MKALLRTDRIFLIVVFLGLFAMAARNVTDPDVWWHLKTGQYIAEHHTVPHTDPFSFTRAGEPWVTHEWLTELCLYQIQLHAGFGGLILTFAAVVCAAFFFLYLRSGSAPYVVGIVTLWAAWATAPVWGARPQVLSLLLASLWLLILERSDRRPKLLFWTLPLTLLWVNLHAGFAVGLVLSALFLSGGLIERLVGKSALHAPFGIQALILFFDFLLVPLNPSRFRMFSYPIETLRSAAMQNYIAEWASPNFHHLEYWPFLLLVLAAFAILSWSRMLVRPRDLILLVVSLYAGLASVRMMPLFVLVAAPLISQRMGNWPRREHPPASQRPARRILNAVIVLAMAMFVSVRVVRVIQGQPAAEARQFPAIAVVFLNAHPPSGPIFNHYDWGGYLIWKLSPSTPVFIDGRADLYGPDLLHEFAETYQLRGSWWQTLLRWHIQTVIVPPESALATGLRAAPGWVIAYEDAQAIVLSRPN